MNAVTRVVTTGVDLLADAVEAQSVDATRVDWRPPLPGTQDHLAAVASGNVASVDIAAGGGAPGGITAARGASGDLVLGRLRRVLGPYLGDEIEAALSRAGR